MDTRRGEPNQTRLLRNECTHSLGTAGGPGSSTKPGSAPEEWSHPSTRLLRRYFPEKSLGQYEYAALWLPAALGRMLDFGCGHGAFLTRMEDRATERYGVDVDLNSVSEARMRPGVIVRLVRQCESLPYPDGWFDTITCLEVLEHVPDERLTLRELCRVLAPGGHLLLTTPHKGWLTFLDAANFKLLFPRIHRLIHCRILGHPEYYEQHFGRAHREAGLFGDISAYRDPWHRHYRHEEVCRFAPPELQPIAWASYFPGYRAMTLLRSLTQVCTAGRVKHLPFPFALLGARLSHIEGRGGDQLVILFQKRSSSPGP